MKEHHALIRPLAAGSALCWLCIALTTHAQTPSAAGPATSEDQPIQLSPFVVDASADTNGYRANSTLAGTRVRTDLKDVASAISVVTQQFLQDTNSHDASDLLIYTPSTEVAGVRGNFTGVAGTGVFQENTVSASTRVRGLDQADNTRDYFLTEIPWDSFNVGRVDLQRGPNSILFGIGSPAGIINNSINDAAFKTTHNVESVIDQWGRFRESIDLNQVLIPQVAAIRLAGVKDDRKYEQRPAFNNTTRLYGALRVDPKIFSEDFHTSIRLKYEDGKVRSNNPRQLPPVDEITPWFTTGTDAYGNPGYNHQTINQFSIANKGPDGKLYPGRTGSTLAGAMFELGGWAQGRSYWPDVINYYEATPVNQNSLSNPNPPSGSPIKTIAAEPNTGLTTNDLASVIGFRPMGIPSRSQYAAYVGNSSGFPGKPIPGGAYYADTVLTDPSIFNFYKYLLDGPNKNEWQNWKAFNGTFEQSFFKDRFAVQVAYDSQHYDNGAHQWMTGSNYAISVDVNQTYADGTPNPNVGRPYVANAASAPSLNFMNKTYRDTFRVTPTYEFRPEDVGLTGTLAKMIGKQNITGVYDRYNVTKTYINWAEYATTSDWTINNTFNDATHTPDLRGLSSGRSFEWLTYVGPSLATKSTASGANLTNLNFRIAPPQNQQTWNFNSRWNKSTTPSDPNYVDPTAPFTYVNYQTGATATGTQAQNPANYVGWQKEQITWMYDSDPNQFPSLVTSASRSRFRDSSRGLTWQGHLLDGDLVPTVGWRRDVITSYQTNAPSATPESGFTTLNFPDDPTSRSDTRGDSKTWGFVYHLPKALMSRLPGDTTLSVFYNRGHNFQADTARLNMAGLHIPNATGDTKEYGFTVTALHDKLILKVDWFKTRVANATLGVTSGNSIGGLGNNAYFIADGSIWGYAWAAALQDGLAGRIPNANGYWDYAVADGFSRGSAEQNAAADLYNHKGGTSPTGKTFVGGDAIVNAWLHDAPFPATFFSSYNLSPPVDPTIGSKTGNLRDSYPLGYNDANGPDAGGGSNFGNHQITVDNLSKGMEVELTWQPVRNWDITANYSKVDATHENIDAAAQQFIGDMTKFMNGPGGQVREWYNGGGPLGDQWNSSIVAPFAVTMNQLGHEAPEVAPWRFNLISRYTFTGDDVHALKGVFLGGALRTEGGRIIGYHYSPTFKNVISDDPRYAAVKAVTLGGLDVNQPFRSSSESHVDAWIGYSRKFGHNLDWRIQLNVRSVGEKTRLRAAQINPDGQIALARITEGMAFELTNSVNF